MKKLLKILLGPAIVLCLFLVIGQAKPANAAHGAGCALQTTSAAPGGGITVTFGGFVAGETVRMFGGPYYSAVLGTTADSTQALVPQNFQVPAAAPAGSYTVEVVFQYHSPPTTSCGTLTVTGGGGGWSLSAGTPTGGQVTFTCGGCPNAGVEIFVVGTSGHSGSMASGSTWIWNYGTTTGTYTANLVAYGYQIVATTTVTVGGGGGGGGNIGTITAPAGIPQAQNPTAFIGGFVRATISLLISAAFIIALIFLIINGIRFVTASGDPKTTSQATSQIWWTLIGLVVVLGSFAIIKLVETFFGVQIISGGFTLPNIN